MSNNRMSGLSSQSLKLSHQGFTLIELMISLVLGLLISAAVVQVYLINTRTLTIQKSASEVQDSSIFTMQGVESHVRLANLGNPNNYITDNTNHGGIVLSKTNLGPANNSDAKLFTTNASSGPSNIAGIASDQLTIQYKNITDFDLYDCEGSKIVKGSSDWVVERYFMRLAPNADASKTVKDLVLACASGRVAEDGSIKTDFSGNGQVIATGAEQFKVLLGTQSDINTISYVPATTYLAIEKPDLGDKPAITSVKLGIIVRSDTPLISESDAKTFNLLGNSHTLKSADKPKKYYRRSYESTVLLRSARVMSVAATVRGS